MEIEDYYRKIINEEESLCLQHAKERRHLELLEEELLMRMKVCVCVCLCVRASFACSHPPHDVQVAQQAALQTEQQIENIKAQVSPKNQLKLTSPFSK